MKFLFLEPFYGGSHRDFADGLIAHSRHRIDLVSLPARFWKWRMRGAALYFANKIRNPAPFSGLIITDLMGLADIKALWGADCPPALAYFHENQLSYPLAPGESMDYQFGFTDITTAASADKVLFNSQTHRDAFFSLLPPFLKMMPEYHPDWVVGAIRSKSGVLYPGCQFNGKNSAPPFKRDDKIRPPLIIWNHRWEFDKNPEEFFAALDEVERMGLDFQLALLGENFQVLPKAFVAARDRFANRIVCYGYEKSKAKYYEWLKSGSIIISTADQENFGIAVVEAVRYGCIPLLPNRLVYPEIIPEELHQEVLYNDRTEMVEKLCILLSKNLHRRKLGDRLSPAMQRFAWDNVIDRYDLELEKLAQKATA